MTPEELARLNRAKPRITPQDLARFNKAAKLIEYDADQGYRTCCQRYGKEVAGALLVAFFRRCFGSMEAFPTPDHVEPQVENHLREIGLME